MPNRRYPPKFKGLRSSEASTEKQRKEKEEFAQTIDNIESISVTRSFEQTVDFESGGSGIIHVVYYDDNGFVTSSHSTDFGSTWSLDTINF